EFGMAGGIIYLIGQTFGTFLAIFLCIRWQRLIAFVDVNNELLTLNRSPLLLIKLCFKMACLLGMAKRAWLCSRYAAPCQAKNKTFFLACTNFMAMPRRYLHSL
ncbi:MAG: hypothetical protein II269_05930, partial [Bacteroidaceae bacterium]|nr:hypothetical protein [Bacteroidaceae bacterium]